MPAFTKQGTTVDLAIATAGVGTVQRATARSPQLLLSNKTGSWAQFYVGRQGVAPTATTTGGDYMPVGPGAQFVMSLGVGNELPYYGVVLEDPTQTGIFSVTPGMGE